MAKKSDDLPCLGCDRRPHHLPHTHDRPVRDFDKRNGWQIRCEGGPNHGRHIRTGFAAKWHKEGNKVIYDEYLPFQDRVTLQDNRDGEYVLEADIDEQSGIQRVAGGKSNPTPAYRYVWKERVDAK